MFPCVRAVRHVKRLSCVSSVFLHPCALMGSSSEPETSGNGLKMSRTRERKVIADTDEFVPELIRNFSIVAHIDHGKSTLADRLLEATGTISRSASNQQVLDKLQVERERGITVKAQTCSMVYSSPRTNTRLLLNLMDTPGHVDFSYEVARSLQACEGVVLLVDANQGVEAQTVANFFLAFDADLALVPVLNKVDLPRAQPDRVREQMLNVFDIEPSTVLPVSAKHGTGIEELLERVVRDIPAPGARRDKPLRCLVFDSWYENFRGAVVMVSVKDGCVSVGDRIRSCHSGVCYDVVSVGLMHPEPTEVRCLYAGQVGYIMCNMKAVAEAQIGDTLTLASLPSTPALPGFREARPMVFAGLYPLEQAQLPELKKSLDKLRLTDRSISVQAETNDALGHGFRLGFLGLLHMDVFNQRLEQEYGALVVVTAPSVPYRARLRRGGGGEVTIYSPSKFPERCEVEAYLEPMVTATIITPDQHLSSIATLCRGRRGEDKGCTYMDQTRVVLRWLFPLAEIITDFFDQLKSLSSGYASLDYEDAGYREADLVKVGYLLNGKPVEELAHISHVSAARRQAKLTCARLKETLPAQLYKVAIQGVVGSKVVAREDMKAKRKDVAAKLYGGDITRKNKLLARQAEGKRRLRLIGNVEVPRDVFIKVLRK